MLEEEEGGGMERTGKDGVRINFCDSKQGGNASHSPCHSDQQTGILFSTETMTLR